MRLRIELKFSFQMMDVDHVPRSFRGEISFTEYGMFIEVKFQAIQWMSRRHTSGKQRYVE